MSRAVRKPRASRRAATAEQRGKAREEAPRPPGARYVYAIVRAAETVRVPPSGLGSKPAPVRLIVHRRLAAVVSDLLPSQLEPTRENVLAHERVNEAVLKQCSLLPVAFGTVLTDDADVREFLQGGYEAFRRALLRLDGHVEYGIKVLCDRDQLIRVLEREDEDLRRLRHEISSQQGSSYFARVQYGRLVERALQSGADQASAHAISRLQDAATDISIERTLGDRVVLSLAALVPRTKEHLFHARLAQLATELERMTVRCTGPWPPYSFVNLRVRVGSEPAAVK